MKEREQRHRNAFICDLKNSSIFHVRLTALYSLVSDGRSLNPLDRYPSKPKPNPLYKLIT